MLEFIFTRTPLMYFTQPFWRDEAFSYLLAAKPIFSIPQLTAQDFSPPLYYMILNIWMRIFGTSEVAIRSLSLFFFACAVYIAFDFITDVLKVRGPRKWIYFALLAANPFLWYYAFEARMYSMLAFCAVASWFALLTHRRRWYIAAVVAGIHTHYFMLLVLVSQIIYIFTQPRSSFVRKSIVRMLIAIGLLTAPWIIFAAIQRPPVQSQFWISSPEWQHVLYIPVMLITGIENVAKGWRHIFLSAVSIFLWLYTGFMIRKIFLHKKLSATGVALIVWVAVPIVLVMIVSVVRPLYLPRYLIFTSIGFLALLVYLLEHSRAKARAVILIFLAVFGVWYHQYQLAYRSKDDIRSTIREIRVNARPDDVIYVDNELNFHTAQYYFDPERVYIISKSYGEIPAYVGKVLIPGDRLRFGAPAYPRRAFIISSDLSYDIQSTE